MYSLKIACIGSFLSALLLVAMSTAEEKPKGKAAGKNHTVEMLDDDFKPKDITIQVGDTITWVNKGENDHTATADKKSDPNFFDTKDVAPGKSSKPVAFKKAGKVPYYCIYHGEPGGAGMSGTITVRAKAKK